MNRNTLYALGRPLSPLYGLLMRLRAVLYRVGVLPSVQVGVPVISVGNLTMGGTGKTPVVESIVRFLQQKGRRPAIISRGYGGKARGRCNIVSEGEGPLLPADVAGDEPRLLSENLPGVPVLTGRVRKFPAQRALELGADCLVLDDGFQHLAIRRDINLVLFHADTMAGNSRVFPGGDLREPVRALNRADAFVMTGVNDLNRERSDRFAALLTMRFPGRPVFRAGYEPGAILDYSEGTVRTSAMDTVRPMPLFGFAGIARPESFAASLRALDLNIVGFAALPDHVVYSGELLDQLFVRARQQGAAACITTQKDMVKLPGLSRDMPLFVLRMEALLDRDLQDFLAAGIERFTQRT